MMHTLRDLPATEDVHLRFWLGEVAFDYRVAVAAAFNLVRDWQRKRWFAIEFVITSIEERLPAARLPNERLFLGP